MAENSSNGGAVYGFGYQYQDGVVPGRALAYDSKYEHEAQKKILLEMEKKDNEEGRRGVEGVTLGYLFGDGSEGPAVGPEGPLACDIEYERKKQSEILWKGNGQRKWLFTDADGNVCAPAEISSSDCSHNRKS